MPTYQEASVLIETRMDALWADQSILVRFENDPRKKPADKYVHLFVRNGREVEMGYAGNRVLYRRPGWINVQCFVLPHQGTKDLRAMSDAIADIFEGQQFSGITCTEAEVEELGDDGEGFYQFNVKIHFDHDYERPY